MIGETGASVPATRVMDPHPSRLYLDVIEACPTWNEAIPDIEAICRSAAEATLAAAGRTGEYELSVLLGDDAAIRALNRDWRGKDKATNVLSFPAGAPQPAGAPLLLGDVALAYETIAREAGAQGKTLLDHTRHLLVHGVLHLLGHDHEKDDEAERMENLERTILARLGVADPYQEEAHG
jgi:probable rRNA maturation factor